MTAFKRRLIDNGQAGPFEAMLADSVRLTQDKRVPFGSTQVIDSVHAVANVNAEKDQQWCRRHG